MPVAAARADVLKMAIQLFVLLEVQAQSVALMMVNSPEATYIYQVCCFNEEKSI